MTTNTALDILTHEDVLTFWFGFDYWKPNPKHGSYYDDLWQTKWFAKEEQTSVTDKWIRDHYEPHVEQAMTGEYDHWTETPDGTLGLIILMDQFCRNIYRQDPRAYASDPKCLQLCLEAIDKGFDEALLPIARAWFYMPLVHSEDINMQALSVEKYARLEAISSAEDLFIFKRFHLVATKHYNVISAFGRYPERNRNLNRKSTPAEAAYLETSSVILKYKHRLQIASIV